MDEKMQKSGRAAAYKLAFGLLIEDMSRSDFERLPVPQQVAFATDIAGLATAEDLMSAFLYLGWLMEKRADALRDYVGSQPEMQS